ncbi:hypothetical protein D9757_009804 [Collybiopsis confluens]|uniref:DDE-1 domain-containing protein n=1 Tax=Collybiopsis confluens TaxID=2823264 RepID=A0A8H5HFD7_9AGAR|nr:hypothetical protein D9757_009804 [Collybiopsis confluens]
MNWTVRAGTRAAAHLPADADDLCERTYFRLVYCMKWEDIPPDLVINVDQQGIYVLPNATKTYHARGDKQVDLVAKDEKRAFTILVASTPTGEILPIQCVWSGKTDNSLPKPSAVGMDEALAEGFHFTVAASATSPRSHFSTLKTMKEWIRKILVPYIQSVIERDGLDKDQKAILYIDVYPVHISKPFRMFVFTEYPNIILIYVPGNCTGKYQPADVGIQRPLKHRIKAALFDWMAKEHQQQLLAGASPEDIRITTSIPKLRDASVAPLVSAYKFMQGPDGRDLIKKAWANSTTVKNQNLSIASLTSKQSHRALNGYLKIDKTLHEEISARCGKVFGLADESAIEADTDRHVDFDDDTDIPFEDVVNATFSGSAESEDGLTSAEVGEDMWAYNNSGEMWSTTGSLPILASD